MNRLGIEKALKSAVDSTPGLSFEQLSQMPYIKMTEHDYITRQTKVRKAGYIRQMSLAAALCLVMVVLLSGWYLQRRESSIITLDVNPSIEIKAGLSGRILSVNALNEDAAKIIGDRKYKGVKLSEGISLLMNSLVEQQYINADKNAILLSVTNRNSKKAIHLKDQIDNTIRDSLQAWNISPTILSQTLTREDDTKKLASQYGLSEGKLKLIQDMASYNSRFTLDYLAGKSIEQLYQLARDNSIDLSKYLAQGSNAGGDQQKTAGKTEQDVTPAKQAEDGQQESYIEEDKGDKSGEDNENQENYIEEPKTLEEDSEDKDSEKQDTENHESSENNKKDRSISSDKNKKNKTADNKDTAENKETSEKSGMDSGDEDGGQAVETMNGNEDQGSSGDFEDKDDQGSGGDYEDRNDLWSADGYYEDREDNQENGKYNQDTYSKEEHQGNEDDND